MSADFLNSLLESGRPVVTAEPTERVDASVGTIIEQLDQTARLELAGTAPPLDHDAALWAVEILESACRFLTYRHFDAETVVSALARPCPKRPSPPVCYSVDLTLRFLPEVIRLARALAPNDPLVLALQELGRKWPLSSVGMREVQEGDLEPFWANIALRTLYVDRVLARGDKARLTDPRVADAARAAVGAYDDLAPVLRAIKTTEGVTG